MRARARQWPREGSRRRNRHRHQPARPDALESRLVLSWPGVPPSSIPIPAAATAVALNGRNDASGSAAIASDEVDYYAFVTPSTRDFVFRARTPTSPLDTVLGVFSATGRRLAHNDDASTTTTDSMLTLRLSAGARYFFGITNKTGTPAGDYAWSVNGPDDDRYEENDSFSTARNLGTLDGGARTFDGLQLRDDDWFRFTTAKASISPTDSVRISFQSAQGDLDLQLFDAGGQLLGESRGPGDSAALGLLGRPAGVYFIRVLSPSGGQNPNYMLTIDPPDDAYEQNDTAATAADLGTIFGDREIRGLQLLDDDWFRFTPIADEVSTHTIRVRYPQGPGGINLAAYDEAGRRIGSAVGSEGQAMLSLPPRGPGPVWVRIYAQSAYKQATYDMAVGKDFPDDEKEENDKPGSASNLGTPNAPLTVNFLRLQDNDYYRFTTTALGGPLDSVRIDFQHAWGDLGLKLYKRVWDALLGVWKYNLLKTSQTGNDFESISLNGRAAATYVVHVYGVAGAKNPSYSLTIDPP